MEVIILLILIAMPSYGVINWAIARFSLVSHISKYHPKLWGELRISDPAGEINGYPKNLAQWLTSRSYRELNDDKLSAKASAYQRARVLVIPCVLIGLVGIGVLSNAST